MTAMPEDRNSLDTTASAMGSLPDNQEGSHGSSVSDERPVGAEAAPGSSSSEQGSAASPFGFYVYVIAFDQEQFGIYATKEAADEALAGQLAEGGPAWSGCKVERWIVNGEPELAS